MNLAQQAENESSRRTRSKLEAHREAIIALRRKRWTYGQIAGWLNNRGVATTLTSVYRFCERTIARRTRNNGQTISEEPTAAPTNQSFFSQTPQIQTNNHAPAKKYRFNDPE